MNPPALLVLTTCPSAEEADGLAAALLEDGIAACVSAIERVRSTYRWQGRIEREPEWLLLIKTTAAQFEAVEEMIRARASHELPEVLAVPVERGSKDYLGWLQAAVGGDRHA